jgi:hypothetical protein
MRKTMIVLLLAAACGKGAAGGGDATAMCTKMWDRGTKVLAHPNQEYKPRYMEKCTAMPVEFLRCRASGDVTAACTETIKANRDGMMELSRALTMGE